MPYRPKPLFAMCSAYEPNKRPFCPCFLGKGKEVINDLKKAQADIITWAALGSGVISLHDLEQEARGKRAWDPNGQCDTTFIDECHKNEIKVLGVVFTGQGHEVGITIDREEKRLIQFGRTEKQNTYWGLEEFYNNRYPDIFKGWSHYFDDALKDDSGQPVKSFLEETACRNIKGELSRALWVSPLAHYFDAKAFLMCKNSPHWRKYLKRIVEMVIDAGADGILFDETAAPHDTGFLGSGFCKHCMKRFREYLVSKYGRRFARFDYRKFLRKRGFGIGAVLKHFDGIPFGDDFRIWQLEAIKKNYDELANHAREYAKSKGKQILVTGNFVEALPFYIPLMKSSDIFNMELNYRIPPFGSNTAYHRLARSLARDKPLTAVPSILTAAYLRNKAYRTGTANLERFFIAEAASCQSNYQIPYSCFTIEGPPYYPDLEGLALYQSFIKNHQDFYEGAPIADVYLIFSFPSYLWTFNWLNYPGRHFLSFMGTEKMLSRLHIPYEIVVWGDGEFLPELPLEATDKVLILPRVTHLTASQREWLKDFSGRIIAWGELGSRDQNNIPVEKMVLTNQVGMDYDMGSWYNEQAREETLAEFSKAIKSIIPSPSLLTDLPKEAFAQSYLSTSLAADKRAHLAIHIVNGRYNESKDGFSPLENFSIHLNKRMARRLYKSSLHTPEEKESALEPEEEIDAWILKIRRVPLYGVVYLEIESDES